MKYMLLLALIATGLISAMQKQLFTAQRAQIKFLTESLAKNTTRSESMYQDSGLEKKRSSYISFNEQQAQEWRNQLDGLLQQESQ